ncbi:MAG: uracil-DNA glycosylase family protein, partial [Sandaracinobacteroides sp.]
MPPLTGAVSPPIVAPMQLLAPMADRPDPDAAAALLDWWKLAGVDTAVADRPASWFTPADLSTPADHSTPTALPATDLPATRHPAAASSRPPADASTWAGLATLAELEARVRADAPRAPFADGDPASGLMILGESPSAEDLRTGRPFSGPAGRFLDRMLAAIGIDRTGCYIGLLCPRRARPGAPDADDIAFDLPLTRAHIRLVAPRHILLLGT